MNAVVETTEETPATPAPAVEEVQTAIDQANGNEVSTDADENSEDNLWGDLEASMDLDEDEVVPASQNETREEEPTPEEVAATPASSDQPEEKTEVTPAAETPVVTEPVVEVATPVEATPPETIVQPETPPAPTLSPEELQAQKKVQRANVVEEMAKHYSLSEEDATTLLTDPGSIMPKMRAEMFIDIFDATMGAVVKAIPDIVRNMNTQTTARGEAEDSFYTANPLLDKGKHSDMVNRLAQTYLSVVPNPTTEKMIKEVGVQAMFLLGIDPGKGNAVAPTAVETPVKEVPYVPAGAGSASVAAPASQDGNVWGNISEELELDD